MKKTIFKIMSLALTIGLLASLIVSAVPAGALVVTSGSASPSTISYDGSDVTFKMQGGLNLTSQYIRAQFTPGTFILKPGATFDFTDGAGAGADILGAAVDYTYSASGILQFNNITAQIGYQWTLTIHGLINPATAGSYPVVISTQAEPTTPQTVNVSIGAVNKVVVYNQAGQYIGTWDNLGDADDNIGSGFTVEIYAGTYLGPGNDFVIDYPNVTVKGMGGAVILSDITIGSDGDRVTVSDLIVIGEGFEVWGDLATVKNVIFNKTAPPGMPGDETLLYIYGNDDTVSNCSFDLIAPSGFQDVGIYIDYCCAWPPDGTVVKDCTFKVDQTLALYQDVAIEDYYGINTTITGNTFTGSSGIGYLSEGSSYDWYTQTEVSNNTFTGCQTAIKVDNYSYDGSRMRIFGNTITGSTVNIPNPAFWNTGAIELLMPFEVYIYDNQITNNNGYAIYAAYDVHTAVIAGNNITNNTGGVFNADGAGNNTLLCTNNYWGASTGPAAGVLDEFVAYVPFLTVANTGAYAYHAWTYEGGWVPNSPPASLAADFAVKNYDFDGMGLVVGQTLSGNPAPMAPPFPAIAYFDIYLGDAPDYDAVQINLYASNLNEASNVYYWSGNMDGWVLCSDQGVAGSGTYAWFKVAPAGSPNLLGNETVPAPDEMTGTYFAIVDGIAPPDETIEPSGPEAGATTGLCNVPFSWPTVPGATAYKIVIWTTDMNNPIVEEMLDNPGFMSGCMDAGSYFWKVYAMQGDDVLSESAVSSFIAQAPPTTTTAPPPITITTQPPVSITITQPPASTITFNPPAEENITPVWIYVIIAIGAVLVIVVIVLIIRTRRTS